MAERSNNACALPCRIVYSISRQHVFASKSGSAGYR